MDGWENESEAPSGRLSRLWQRGVEPAASVRGAAARQRARVTAALLLPILAFSLAGVFVSAPVMAGIYAVMSVIAAAAYAAGRTRHVDLAGLGATLACAVTPYFGIWSDAPTTSSIVEIMWLVLTVVVAGLTLPFRLLVAVGTLNLAAVAALLLTNRGIPLAPALQVCGFILLLTVLVTITSRVHLWHEEQLAHRTRELLTEVRERKRAQKALQEAKDVAEAANEAKGRFLANISHELRTPMSGIIGMSRLLLAEPLPPQAQSYADLVKSSAESLLQLLDDVLDFSKIEAGKMALDPEDFGLRETLRRIVDLLAPKAAEKGLELELEIDSRLPDRLRGDLSRLRQVLFNLVGNGLKFTADGEVVVGARLEALESDGVTIAFSVRDTGIGIAPEFLPHLFAPFVQEDESHARRFGGTGLGLAISKRLVEMMGGTITVESEPAAGSTFRFTARFLHSRETSAARKSGPLRPRPLRSRFRVLVADDNAVNLMITVKQLQAAGYQADAVANGREALEALARGVYHLLLTDCQMPELDGYETTRLLRQQEDGRTRIPVIAVTASAMQGDREKCLAAGMDDYIAKPFRTEELVEILDRWLPGTAGPGLGSPKTD